VSKLHGFANVKFCRIYLVEFILLNLSCRISNLAWNCVSNFLVIVNVNFILFNLSCRIYLVESLILPGIVSNSCALLLNLTLILSGIVSLHGILNVKFCRIYLDECCRELCL